MKPSNSAIDSATLRAPRRGAARTRHAASEKAWVLPLAASEKVMRNFSSSGRAASAAVSSTVIAARRQHDVMFLEERSC
jgi:hypothetical protein